MKRRILAEARRAWHELRSHYVWRDPDGDVIVCVGCRKEWPA